MQTMLSVKSRGVDSGTESKKHSAKICEAAHMEERLCDGWSEQPDAPSGASPLLRICPTGEGFFAAGPLRQHLLGWMVLVESGPQRPDGWLELLVGWGDLRMRDAIQWLCVLVLLLCVIALGSVDFIQSDVGNKAELSAIIPRSQKAARKEKGDVCLFP